MRWSLSPAAVVAVLLPQVAYTSTELDKRENGFSIESDDAIRQTASTLAWDLMQYYKGNLTGAIPGVLPGPPPAGDYYWWQAGAMWTTLIQYWSWTGDSTYNDHIMESLLFQTGENKDYMPRNHTASLGNDDQAFWGMAAMTAAEMKFPDPPQDGPQWLELAQAVFNTQASPLRHDEYCNGGLRWQIPFANTGYDYKNTIANGCFFNLGARLYRYTGNTTYRDWAIKTWDWMEGVKYINQETYAVYDGGWVADNCTKINRLEFSYNNGILAHGAAFLYNATEDDVWKTRVEKLVKYGFDFFFPDGIAVERACELGGTCNADMVCFKGFVHRWYSVITQLVPSIRETIAPVLRTSAEAAIKQCTGGDTGRACGLNWASGKYDGKTDAGRQMSALAAVAALLIDKGPAPVTNSTGGTSRGNPNAGSDEDDNFSPLKPITTADRAGAGILTVLLAGCACAMFAWMIMD